MHLKLGVDARSHAEAYGTQQPAAYDFYLQGLGYLQNYDKEENVENAIRGVDTRPGERQPAFAGAIRWFGEAYWEKFRHHSRYPLADVATLKLPSTAIENSMRPWRVRTSALDASIRELVNDEQAVTNTESDRRSSLM